MKMILQLLIAFIVSLIVTAAVGYFLVPALSRAKAGQSIRQDGPIWHSGKQGTPIMGGLMFIAGITITCLVVGFRSMLAGDFRHIFILTFALVFAAIGFLDDYEKLRKKQNLGLKVKQKFLLQLIVSLAFVALMRLTGNLSSSLYIPFFDISASIPEPIYIVFAAFVAVGTVNAVNITDGVDGLASGVTLPVAIWFGTVAGILGYLSLGVFAAALAGGLIAFLFYNFHPAKVFMGDTGSLFLGGAVCAMAFALDLPLILIPLGIVYFVETLSDIIQISYFKITKGKRVFKMAPIHHHFEMCGWSEYKLFAVFTTVSAIFAVISYFGVLGRFA
ncbi:MAG: phospho-N-acetylmuramoyl-pentapeptide-transferase [Oscillospiraceae bacterium]|nr:phospho-N-acetylmuramoyl-pentapeptide-transferase [Oscillospiraceae bacterium]